MTGTIPPRYFKAQLREPQGWVTKGIGTGEQCIAWMRQYWRDHAIGLDVRIVPVGYPNTEELPEPAWPPAC